MRVLIIKTSAFGDIIQAFPAVQFLKQIHPACKIDWVVEKRCAELIRFHPLIDHLFVIDTKNWKTWSKTLQELRKSEYDVVFDFQGNTKSGVLLGFSKSQYKVGFGYQTVAEWPNLLFSNFKVNPLPDQNIRLDYLALVETFFAQKCVQMQGTLLNLPDNEQIHLNLLRKKKDVKNWMICPGSQWINKQLLAETWISYLKKLNPPRLFLVYGNEKELKLCQTIQSSFHNSQILEKMSFPLLQHWMKEMDLIFAVDSMLLHLAGETNIPTQSFFGPSLAKKYQPVGPDHHSIQGACPYNQNFSKRCPYLRTCKTGACLHDRTL